MIEEIEDAVWCGIHGNVHGIRPDSNEDYDGLWGSSDATECQPVNWTPVGIVWPDEGPAQSPVPARNEGAGHSDTPKLVMEFTADDSGRVTYRATGSADGESILITHGTAPSMSIAFGMAHMKTQRFFARQ